MTLDYKRWTVQAITERVQRLYEQTPDPARHAGARWYPDANLIARDMSAGSGWTLAQCSGIIAAFSNRTPWDRNIDHALTFATGQMPRTMQRQLDLANRIASLTGPTAESMRDIRAILNGPKISAFADNIFNPAYSPMATLDTHMARALGLANYSDLALRVPVDGANPNGSNRVPTESLYSRIDASFRHASTVDGIPVPERQATIWVDIRGSAD